MSRTIATKSFECDISRQIVLVLVGLPGCGKSTFSKKLIHECELLKGEETKLGSENGSLSPDRSLRREWAYVNQDMLKNRGNCIKATEKFLREDKNVIVDRCNFDKDQRKTWITLAQTFGASPICVVLPKAFDSTFCSTRAFERGVDELHGDLDWGQVCRMMQTKAAGPSKAEGFDAIVKCKEGQDLDIVIRVLLNKLSTTAGGDIATTDIQEKMGFVPAAEALKAGSYAASLSGSAAAPAAAEEAVVPVAEADMASTYVPSTSAANEIALVAAVASNDCNTTADIQIEQSNDSENIINNSMPLAIPLVSARTNPRSESTAGQEIPILTNTPASAGVGTTFDCFIHCAIM